MACHCNAHTVPKFPLAYNLWRNGNLPSSPPDASGICQLHVSGLSAAPAAASTFTGESFVRYLFLPKGADVRGNDLRPTPDTVEVPAGSKRMYQITSVDDVAKGFANEFRVAQLVPVLPFSGGMGPNPYWPLPYP